MSPYVRGQRASVSEVLFALFALERAAVMSPPSCGTRRLPVQLSGWISGFAAFARFAIAQSAKGSVALRVRGTLPLFALVLRNLSYNFIYFARVFLCFSERPVVKSPTITCPLVSP